MAASIRKPRRKSDGSYELPVSCQVCGSRKCEMNSETRQFHCFSCSAGGVAPDSWGYGLSFLSARSGASPPPTGLAGVPDDLTEKLPIFALQEIKRRRQEPYWLTQRYRVRWSFSRSRLWFPAGEGGVLRSVLSWEEPKTIAVPPRGLVGEHLLHDGIHLVIVEGDWKAVSIPLPWTGVAIQGVTLSDEQRFKIKSYSYSSVTVMLDGGCHIAAQEIVESLLPLKAVRVDLPGDSGPDDVPRSELVNTLLKGR